MKILRLGTVSPSPWAKPTPSSNTKTSELRRNSETRLQRHIFAVARHYQRHASERQREILSSLSLAGVYPLATHTALLSFFSAARLNPISTLSATPPSQFQWFTAEGRAATAQLGWKNLIIIKQCNLHTRHTVAFGLLRLKHWGYAAINQRAPNNTYSGAIWWNFHKRRREWNAAFQLRGLAIDGFACSHLKWMYQFRPACFFA